MNKSIKINFAFNLMNTVFGMLFPLITFPYAARIICADGIGKVNFLTSIVGYVCLLTTIGIPMYAVREVARCKENKNQLYKTTLEILYLSLSLVALGYLLCVVLGIYVDRIHQDLSLFSILSLSIILNAIGCEWFFQGIEEFAYITIRGFIFRIFSVIFLFVFVHNKTDLLYYAVYSVLVLGGGNIINFYVLRKRLSEVKVPFKELDVSRHLLPSLHLFALNLIVNLYVQLNPVMLGFLDTDSSVGYFTSATKITHVLMGVIAALSGVVVPRMSAIIVSNDKIAFKKLAQKALRVVIMLSLPLSVSLFICAPYLIRIMCGEEFIPAIMTLRILSPIIFVISLGGVICTQILYPLGRINRVIIATSVGAIVNLVLDLILIPYFSQDGAAIATTICECCVTILAFLVGFKYCPITFRDKSIVHYLVATILMAIALFLLPGFFYNNICTLIIYAFVGVSTYFGYLMISKETLCIETYNSIKKIIKRHD